MVRATGGLGLLGVNEPPNARAGLVRVSNIWWRGATLVGLAVQNFYRGTIELDHNRVTDIRAAAPVPLRDRRRRPARARVGVLTGKLVIRDNYVDTTANPFLPGDDNGIGLQGAAFDTVDWTHNTAITKGESLEIEDSTGVGPTTSRTTSCRPRVGSTRCSPTSWTPSATPTCTVATPRPSRWPATTSPGSRSTTTSSPSGGGSSTMVCIMPFMADPERVGPPDAHHRDLGEPLHDERHLRRVVGGLVR